MASRPLKKPRAVGDADGEPHFSLGRDTYRVPMRMHRINRRRLVEKMTADGHSGVVVLRGGETTMRHDTDTELVFRQESYFQWCFGVKEPDCYGIISLRTGAATLLIPRMSPESVAWVGEIEPPESYKARYCVENVGYTEDLLTAVAESCDGGTIHVLYGQNTDSDAFSVPALTEADLEKLGPERLRAIPPFDRHSLFQVIAGLRVIKTRDELALLQHVSNVSSAAHVDVMRNVRPGMGEYQLESLFHHFVYFRGGCRLLAYTCICACGPNGAVLHYGHAGRPNDRTLEVGDMGLLDMGAEYHCYCADITCSYPISGKFSDRQRMVYNGVLEAVKAVETTMKPGVAWPAMHRLATRVILQWLTDHGLLQGSVDDMVEVNLGKIFFPCGLGHFIGLDTHDVGGYLNGFPERIDEGPYGIRKLRTARTLEAGMVLTVEPGIYFVNRLMDMAHADEKLKPFLTPKLNEFRDFGGVRIEDVVTVTDTGIDNWTLCPRTCDEIESVMAGGAWPPATDEAKYLSRRWKATPKATFSKWSALTAKGTEPGASAACC